GVGQAEQLSEMNERARRLLAADHMEVILQTVEVGEKDDAGLVEPGRRLEDVPRQRKRRRQGGMERIRITGRELPQSKGSSGCNGIEDAEQRIRVASVVARDQLRVVEVVASIHANALGETAAHHDLFLF